MALRAQHPPPRPAPDRALQAGLEGTVAGFRGIAGVYVRHLPSGRWAAIRPDETFPTASLIKVPILGAFMGQVAAGRYAWKQRVAMADSLRYTLEDDLVAKVRTGDSIPIGTLALLAITTSDNTAALWLQGLVGGAEVNAWLARHGFQATRVNSRTPGREAQRAQWGWGQTTPREIAELLVAIREGRVGDRTQSEALYRHLTRIHFTGEALGQLPPWVQAASKQGEIRRSRAEVVLVNAPGGDYVFSVLTKEQADTSDARENEGFRLIRAVSRLLWRTFEPRRPYRAPDGGERYTP